MSIEKVQEKIIENANSKASQIIKEEETKLNNLMQAFLEISRLEFEQKKTKSFEEVDKEFKRRSEIEALNLETAVLVEKTRLLDKFFSTVMDVLLNMSDEDYYNFLVGLIEKNVIKDSCEILLNEKDHSRFGKKMSNFLAKTYGKNVRLSEKNINIKGGCVVIGKEVQFDNSFESILKEVRENSEVEINKSLFKET